MRISLQPLTCTTPAADQIGTDIVSSGSGHRHQYSHSRLRRPRPSRSAQNRTGTGSRSGMSDLPHQCHPAYRHYHANRCNNSLEGQSHKSQKYLSRRSPRSQIHNLMPQRSHPDCRVRTTTHRCLRRSHNALDGLSPTIFRKQKKAEVSTYELSTWQGSLLSKNNLNHGQHLATENKMCPSLGAHLSRSIFFDFPKSLILIMSWQFPASRPAV